MAHNNDKEQQNINTSEETANNQNTDQNGTNDANAENRESIREGAPSALHLGRTTVSELNGNSVPSEEKTEEKVEEKTEQTVEQKVEEKVEEKKDAQTEVKKEETTTQNELSLTDLATVTAKQIAKALEKAQLISKESVKNLIDLFNSTLKALEEGKKEKKDEKKEKKEKQDDPEKDASIGTMLACQAILFLKDNPEAQKFVKDAFTTLAQSFGISAEDCKKVCDSVATLLGLNKSEEKEKTEEKKEEKNEYPEEPDDKKEIKKEEVKKEEPNKEEKPSPDQLKDRMNHLRGLYETTTGMKTDGHELDDFTKAMSSLGTLSPELRQSTFNQTMRELSKRAAQNAVSVTAAQRKNGKTSATFTEATDMAQKYVKAQFDYLQSQNPALSDLKYPTFGGLQPSELREMQNTALLSLPGQQKYSQEKKEINDSFVANKATQAKAQSSELKSVVGNLNREQGVRFSSDGIEKYLTARWKESAGEDLDAQRANFKAEMKEFQQKAYEKMLSKIDGKTDLAKQLNSFDQFTAQLENVCKAKGWMDKDEPHKYGGELTSNDIKTMQTKAVKALPKNSKEKAIDSVNIISGEKDKIKKKEEKQEEKQELKGQKGKKKSAKKKKIKQNKKALEKKPTEKGKPDDFMQSIQSYIDAVPKNPESFDNQEVRTALDVAKAVEAMKGNHGKVWNYFHRSTLQKYDKAVNHIMNSLQEKGYQKEILDHLMHNPEKPESDPTAEEVKKQQEQVEKISVKQDKLEKEQIEFSEELGKNKDGEKISVPEADNIQEIVKPKERSPFIATEKNKQLEVNDPAKQNNEQIKPQGPTTGK